MRVSETKILRRLQKLENAERLYSGAFVNIVRADGSRKRMLWTTALLDALDGSGAFEGDQVTDVDGGELAGLIKAVLL